MSDKNYTEILQHRIKFNLFDDGPQELDKEGCNQGELYVMSDNQEIERRGWWSIEKAEYKSDTNFNSKEQPNLRDQLITAGFFMEGLHDARPDHNVKPNYDALIETWGKGCIELVDTLVGHVPLTVTLCEAAAAACDGNYPGVFDYEVSNSFGKWFGEYIIEQGDEPSPDNARAWLVFHIAAFFTQYMTEEEAKLVKTAINDALVLANSGGHLPE